jgi:hypothetical protein
VIARDSEWRALKESGELKATGKRTCFWSGATARAVIKKRGHAMRTAMMAMEPIAAGKTDGSDLRADTRMDYHEEKREIRAPAEIGEAAERRPRRARAGSPVS